MTNETLIAALGDDNSAAESDGVGLIDIAQIIAENLRVLIILPMVVSLGALGATFLVAPTYTATATFLPPQQQQSMASSLLQSLGAIGGLAGASSALKNPNDQYVSFLKSNAVEDSLIARFDLMTRYDDEFKADARKSLEKNTRVISGKDNIIAVEFDDKDPAFAAQIANAYGEELTKLLGRLAITEAQQRRLFFGKQLASTKDNLIAAEQALAATGVSVGALNANPNTAMVGPATLRAQVTAQEVKIASMRAYLADGAPEFRQAQAELAALQKELVKTEGAQPANARGGNDYIAKFRDFKYQETLFDLFSRQYEIARIDESREGATVQVIDMAQPPEKKAKPKRAVIALIGGGAAFVLWLIFVFMRNAWRNALSDEKSAQRIEDLQRTFRRSLGRQQ